MSDYNYLPVSNGSGDTSLMHLTANRANGATTFTVDSVVNVPPLFIATIGTILPTGFIDPATKLDFKGHLSGATLVLDAWEPGSVDPVGGSTAGQVIVIKPNTGAMNRIASFIKNMTGFGTPEAITVNGITNTGNNSTSGNASIGGALTVTGNATVTGVSTFTGDLTANGKINTSAVAGRFYRGGDGVHAGASWYGNVMDNADFIAGGALALNGDGGIKCLRAGWYQCTGTNTFQDVSSGAGTAILAGFNINNGSFPAWYLRGGFGGNPSAFSITRTFHLSVNDVFYLFEYCGATTNYRIKGGNGADYSSLEMVYLGT